MSGIGTGEALKSRGRSKDSENSPHCFDVPMASVTLDAFESQLLRLQRPDIEAASGWNPARHSTSSCIGVDRRELDNVRWNSLQWRNENMAVNFDGSFRSEDSEILALWEEKSEAGLDRLGGRRGKATSTDAGRQKPVGAGSPWRESVSNAVKMIESFSYAMVNNKEKQRTTWPRCSPIHPKAAGVESPRQSVDKRDTFGPSPRRDFKIRTNSSPRRNNTESVLHNSPKARYSYGSPRRRGEFEYSPSPITAPELFCQAVSCELQLGSSRPVDFNSRRKDDEREYRSLRREFTLDTGVSISKNELNPSCVQAKLLNHGNLSNTADRVLGTQNQIPQESLLRTSPVNASNSNDVYSPPRAFLRQPTTRSVEAVDRALPPRYCLKRGEKSLTRPCSKFSSQAMPEFNERFSAQYLDEAVLSHHAREAGEQQCRPETLTSGETKASHRYYQKVTSAERSSRWSSSDGNYMDSIDFVAPSAARFLEGSDGCVSPALAPIKTEGAIPFQWEKEPGKPKRNSESATDQSQSALQLPPRLATPQQKQDPRNRSINVAMIETDALPNSQTSSSMQLPRAQSNSERAFQASLNKSPVKAKSRSVGEVRATLHNMSHHSASHAGIGDARRQRSGDAPQGILPAHLSGKVRPMSPTSILCGPDDGSRPSSNPSLCSDHEAPLISAMIASSLSHCSSPSRASFDSVETTSPESSLTSPLRANSRCNSMFHDDMRQEGPPYSGNALVKFYKNGKRWMKSKGQISKLGTIPSPGVSAPGFANQREESNAELGNVTVSESASRCLMECLMEERRSTSSSEFVARLEGKPSHISRIDESNVQTDRRFAPSTVVQEDLGNWSPAYAATLELLSPLRELSSKNKKPQVKTSGRLTRKNTRHFRVRVKVRARFLVPIRRALRKMLSRCAFRRHTQKVKARESKLLYHVDYTLTPANFSFKKPI